MACLEFTDSVRMQCAFITASYSNIKANEDGEADVVEMVKRTMDYFITNHYPEIYKVDKESPEWGQFLGDVGTVLFIMKEMYDYGDGTIEPSIETSMPGVFIDKLLPFANSHIDSVIERFNSPNPDTIKEDGKKDTPVEPEIKGEDTEGTSSDETPLTPNKLSRAIETLNVSDTETRSISELIKDVLGMERVHMYDSLIEHMRESVANGWVDQRVDSNGNVRGFKSRIHSALDIEASIRSRLTNHLDKFSNAEIVITTKNGKQFILKYFDSLENAHGLSLATRGGRYEMYNHKILREGTLSSDNKQAHVKLITGEDFDSVVEALKENHTIEDVAVTREYDQNRSEGADPILKAFDGVSKFSQEDEIAFYDYVIASNYELLLKNYYPQLHEGYKEKFRTGFVANTAGVAAGDSDSASTKMHKQTTMALEFNGFDQPLKLSKKRYLSLTDYDSLAQIVQSEGFPRDKNGIGRAIRTYLETNPSTETANILASVYFKFFAEEDYQVQDGDKTITMRSYSSIAGRNGNQTFTSIDDYVKGEQEQNDNKTLELSLSKIIGSLTGSVPHESFIVSNGSGRTTNSQAYGVMGNILASYTSPYISKTVGDRKFIRKEFLEDLQVIPGVTKNNFTVRIKLSKRKNDHIDYDVKLAPINGDKFAAFPFFITQKGDPLNDSQLKRVFSRFNLPSEFLSDDFIRAFNSNKNLIDLINVKNNSPLEQYLLTQVMMMEMNTEDSAILNKSSDAVALAENEGLKFDPTELPYGFNNTVKTALREVFGEDRKPYSYDHSGNRLANITVKNKIMDTPSLAKVHGEGTGSIHAESFITGENPEAKVVGFFSKTGLKQGDTIRSNEVMSLHEQAVSQIELGFLQQAAFNGFQSTLLQFGVMSDRSDVPLAKIQLKNKEFLPEKAGRLDSTQLYEDFVKSQRGYYNRLEAVTLSEWKRAIAVLNTQGLAEIDIDVDSINNLKELNEELIKANIPYEAVKTATELVDDAMVIRNGSYAIVSPALIQTIELFNNDTLLKDFLATNYKRFVNNLRSTGYNSISDKSFNIIKKRFNKVNTKEAAWDTLMQSYFYHSNTLGHEILRLHTGGFSQFKHPRNSVTDFNISRESTDYKAIVDIAASMVVTLPDGTPKSISALTDEEVSMLNQDSKAVLYHSILNNESLAKKDPYKEKALALLFSDINKVHSNQFIDQFKRNAGMGSTHQQPRIVADNESGVMLGQFSKNVTIDDPKDKVLDIIGKSGLMSQDKFDAVQLAHPLYFIKLGNSLGGPESGYSPTGAPVKDITNEVDALGFYRFQKKATFDLFSNELLSKSAELHNLLERMNRAVKFTDTEMMVPKKTLTTGSSEIGNFDTALEFSDWLKFGESLGYILDTSTDTVVHASTMLNNLKAEIAALGDRSWDIETVQKAFKAKFDSGIYRTDKVKKNFNNMQQLWEYFGSTNSDTAWEDIAQIVSYQPSVVFSPENSELHRLADLRTGRYSNRDAYIEKVGFKTQEKTGSKQTLPSSTFLDPGFEFGNESGFKAYSEIDNTYHGVILQADHNPDTTTSDNIAKTEEEHENEIPMVTQVLSALVAEGFTSKFAGKAFNAVGEASRAFIENLNSTIDNKAQRRAKKAGVRVGSTEFDKIKLGVIEEYLKDAVKEGMRSRDSSGIINDLVSKEFEDSMSFDLKQVLPLLRSMLLSRLNRETVRMKFAGGQYVVSPSEGFILTYSIGDVKGLTRQDLNAILYSNTKNKALKEAALKLSSYELAPINTSNISGDDIVIITEDITELGLRKGQEVKYSEVKRRAIAANIDAKQYSQYTQSIQYRLGKAKTNSSTLNWSSYVRIEEDGTKTDITKTDEYESFLNVKEIAIAKPENKPFLVTRGHMKLFYFAKGEGFLNRQNIPGTDVPGMEQYNTDKEEEAFQRWYELNESNNNLRWEVADFITDNFNADPSFVKVFEKKLMDLLKNGKWFNEPSEFYMPPMHAEAYLIKDGDSLVDIIGTYSYDVHKLIDSGILKPGTYVTKSGKKITFSSNEDIVRQFEMDYRSIEVVLKGSDYYNNLSDIQKPIFDEVFRNKAKQTEHMVSFFSGRIDEEYKPLRRALTSAKSISEIKSLTNSILRKADINSELGKFAADINYFIDKNKGFIGTTKRGRLITEAMIINQARISEKYNIFRASRANKMATGFTTTLDFITARIPAQGMQSATIGRIKNFIFSTRNSCYGPIKMLTMTGADYDIDKQNMMSWFVNNDDEVIDWRPFLNEEGEISYDMFKTWVKENNLPANAASDYYIKAVQNFIVHNMMTVLKDPINAIQANTPVSMAKMEGSKPRPNFTEGRSMGSVQEILDLTEYASPYNPFSILQFEKLNMEGKSGIGIFASDLKSYFAAYYAVVNATKDEEVHTVFKSNSGLNDTDAEALGIDKEAIQYFDIETGEVLAESKSLANTARFTSRGRTLSSEASEFKAKMDKLNQETTEEEELTTKQITLLTTYVDKFMELDGYDVSEQAWEDLSELLSAATDNAKELILGKINATSATSSIISTMIRVGIDLKHALDLVGHSGKGNYKFSFKLGGKSYTVNSVRELMQKLSEVDDTQKNVFGNNRLLSILEDSKNQFSSSKDKVGNPFKQLYTFAKMTEEFGLLSSLLSINQGLKNGDFDEITFVRSLDRRANDLLGRSGVEFSIKEFINGDDAYRNKIIKAFDKNRTSINVPFILNKNKHYFGYYRAMFKGSSMIRKVSGITRLVETLIAKVKATKIEDRDFKKLKDYIYGVTVESYMRYIGNVSIGDKTFNLAKATTPLTDTNSIGGRVEFMDSLPAEIRKQLDKKDNFFLSSLPLDSSVEDFATKIVAVILKGPNLLNISSEKFSKLQLGVESLKVDNPELHRALFLYSLIQAKGGHAGGAFTSLYDTGTFADFSKYIKDNIEQILKFIEHPDNKETMELNNPIFIPKYTTNERKAGPYFANLIKSGSSASEDDMSGINSFDDNNEMPYDEFMSDDELGGGRNYVSKLDIKAEDYSMSDVTEAKKDGLIEENLFRSIETGIIYKWDDDVELWIPKIQTVPTAAIPYSVVFGDGTGNSTGFTDGWEFSTGLKTANGLSIMGSIISYIDPYNASMFKKAGVNSKDLDSSDDNYLVKIGNQYEVMTKSAIYATSGNNFILNGALIELKSSINKQEFETVVKRAVYSDENGNLFATNNGTRKLFPKTLYSDQTKTLTNSRLIGNFDHNVLMSIIKDTIRGNTTSMDEGTLAKKYKDARENFLQALLKEAADGQSVDLLSPEVVEIATNRANMQYPKDIDILEKLDILYNQNKIFENNISNEALRVFDKFDIIPSAITSIFKKDKVQGYNWEIVQSIFNKIGAKSRFKELVEASLFDTDIAEVYIDNKSGLMLVKDKSMIEEPSIFDRYSKEHKVPSELKYTLSRKASPEVMNKFVEFLNKRFNGAPISLLSTADIKTLFGEDYIRDGVKGFTMNGNVILNSDRITMDTPVHELSHIYMQYLKLDNPELYGKIVKESLNHPLAAHMKESYKDLSDNDLGEEVFVSLVASDVVGKTLENSTWKRIKSSVSEGKSTFGKIMNFFKSLFSEAFGINMNDYSFDMNDSLSSIIDKLGSDVVFGKKSVFNTISSETKSNIDALINKDSLDYSKAEQFLMERGFIKIVCT
jgi:hypothetical protein